MKEQIHAKEPFCRGAGHRDDQGEGGGNAERADVPSAWHYHGVALGPYERFAADLENVDVRPSGHDFGFARTGSVMDVMTCGATGGNAGPATSAPDTVPPPTSKLHATEAGQAADEGNSQSLPTDPGHGPETLTEPEFGRLKESKF